MSRPHVLEFSQLGRTSATAASRFTGLPPALIMTRLYGPPTSSPGTRLISPMPVRVQNACCPGMPNGTRGPFTRSAVTGSAPVPMSTVRTWECGTPAR
ncbi:hypothetical protein ACQP2E_04885 [Actinoplanes sp. CA-015351]|uniref:hypothetical protein n=1 Tax=Actinoplanes sp. CA-015351 TaxID=3239897 RepID=UPI003D9632B3